jgi:hypothetical protein
MENRQRDLAQYRLEKAKENLDSSLLNLENNKFAPSINRSRTSAGQPVTSCVADT